MSRFGKGYVVKYYTSPMLCCVKLTQPTSKGPQCPILSLSLASGPAVSTAIGRHCLSRNPRGMKLQQTVGEWRHSSQLNSHRRAVPQVRRILQLNGGQVEHPSAYSTVAWPHRNYIRDGLRSGDIELLNCLKRSNVDCGAEDIQQGTIVAAKGVQQRLHTETSQRQTQRTTKVQRSQQTVTEVLLQCIIITIS